MGSGCGSVGRAVACDTRGRRSNPVIGKLLLTVNCIEKTKIKKKRSGKCHLYKNQGKLIE